MNTIIERLMGIDTMTDQVVAMDMLMAAKTGIKMYALAATESSTPEVKATFEKHLFEEIDMHAKLTAYAMASGIYHPYNICEQFVLDQQNAQMAVNAPSPS